MKPGSSNFISVIVAAVIFGFIISITLVSGHTYINGAYAVGQFLGALISCTMTTLIVSFFGAVLINSIINLFRKNKKPFSYILVWILLILSFLIIANISLKY